MLAIIGGTSLAHAGFLKGLKEDVRKNAYGEAYLLRNKDIAFLPRHGRERTTPAHRINHKANIMALSELGVDYVLGVCCAGSLKEEICPGSLAVPDDYMSLSGIETFHDSDIRHITPGLDEELREKSLDACRDLGMHVHDRGVYLQTTGPRLETKAEVRFYRTHADLVGMTMASEATLSKELDMGYCGLCTVDNYAHGIKDERIDFEKIIVDAEKNRERLERIIAELEERI